MAFKTNRLTVNSLLLGHLPSTSRDELLRELKPLLTAPVLKHLPPPLQLSNASNAIEEWITNRTEEAGVLLVRDTAHTLIGLVLLAEMDDTAAPEIHIGYLLGETAWGKGYGSELIQGLVTWMKVEHPKATLFGGVEDNNPRSARVLEKAGFTPAAIQPAKGTIMFQLVI